MASAPSTEAILFSRTLTFERSGGEGEGLVVADTVGAGEVLCRADGSAWFAPPEQAVPMRAATAKKASLRVIGHSIRRLASFVGQV
jgi:hypothetical protein